MFAFLMIVGFIGALLMFISWGNSNFANMEALISSISMLISALLCFKLMRIETKTQDNQAEIEALKVHLGLKEEEPIDEEFSEENFEEDFFEETISDENSDTENIE